MDYVLDQVVQCDEISCFHARRRCQEQPVAGQSSARFLGEFLTDGLSSSYC